MRYIILILLFPVWSFGQACFVTDGMAFEYQEDPTTTGRSLENHCITIYVETDFYTFQQHGSVAAVQAWIDKLEANVKIMYANEEINVSFVDPHIPTAPDWSEQYNSALDLLNAFGIVRKNSPGHMKHFITMRPLGGGIAWVNVLCVQTPSGNSAGPFAVMTQMTKTFPNYPTWSWNVGGFVHEMGHNLGSKHTQDCVWGPTNNERIDDCVFNNCAVITPIERSTIMSYCHNTSWGTNLTLGFGTLPGELIRQRVNAAACVESAGGTITLSGNVTGTYSKNIINLNNANATNLTLHASEVNVNNSTLNPLFTTYIMPAGCQ